MKASIFASSGHLSPSLLKFRYDKSVIESELEKAISKGSFLSNSLTDSIRKRMIYQYDKYTIVRHPLERVVSVYRDKMSGPLSRKPQPIDQYFAKFKQSALSKCDPQLHKKWKEKGVDDVSVSFTCFIVWYTKHGGVWADDHFMMLVDNCQPCRMHYHFYGNFKSFVNDGRQILSKFTDDLSPFANESYYTKGNGTNQLLPSYYSQLTPSLRKSLQETIKLDLDFYHTLYPSGKQLTEDLLDL